MISNKKLSKAVASVLFTGVCFGCALPKTKSQRGYQGFVPQKQLDAVDLAREGLGYLSSQRYFDAEGSFRRALYIYPDADNIRANLAAALEGQRSYREAYQLLDGLLRKNPNSVELNAAMGRLHFVQGQHSQAVKFYERAFSLVENKKRLHLIENPPPEDPTKSAVPVPSETILLSASIARSLSVAYFTLGLEEQALCYSFETVRINPTVAELVRHARLLIALNRFASARAAIESYSSAKNPSILHQLAIAAFGEGKFEESLKFEESALEAPAGDEDNRIELNLVKQIAEQKVGKKEEASDKEELEEEQEEILSAAEALERLNPQVFLYWPPTLLSALEVVEESPAEDQ